MKTLIQESSLVMQSWLPYFQYRSSLFPDALKLTASFLFVILVFALCLAFYLKTKPPRKFNPILQIVFASFLVNVIYGCAFCATYLLADPQPPIITRMFTPILPSIALWIISCLFYLHQQVPKSLNKYSAFIIAMLIILPLRYYALRTLAITKTSSEKGYGYTAREIQTSGFLEHIKQIPTGIPLIANTPALTLLYTNRMPYPLDFIPTVPLGTRSMEIDQIFVSQKAALILDYASIRNVYADWQERLAYFTNGLEIAFQDEIGGIYYYPAAR